MPYYWRISLKSAPLGGEAAFDSQRTVDRPPTNLGWRMQSLQIPKGNRARSFFLYHALYIFISFSYWSELKDGEKKDKSQFVTIVYGRCSNRPITAGGDGDNRYGCLTRRVEIMIFIFYSAQLHCLTTCDATNATFPVRLGETSLACFYHPTIIRLCVSTRDKRGCVS